MRSDLRRPGAALMGALLATTVLVVPVAAQDTTDSPPPASCDVLTADEVSAALGETLTISSGSGTDCQFDADYASGRFMSLLTSYLTDSSLDDWVGLLCGFLPSPTPGTSPTPCSIDLTIGDAQAAYLPQGFGTALYVAQDGDLFSLTLTGDAKEGVDKQAALTALAEAALPRLASVPRPTAEPMPSFEPGPTFLGDAALEALFPAEIGGVAVDITSMSGQDLLAQGNTDVPQELNDALAAQGKTVADVSVAFGTAYDPSDGSVGSIIALQVHGADIGPIGEAFLPIMNNGQAPAAQTPGEVAGKAVTIVTPEADSGPDSLIYAYDHDDILWLVQAVEPDLTEVFQKLP